MLLTEEIASIIMAFNGVLTDVNVMKKFLMFVLVVIAGFLKQL
jgi:hypothetical protein